MSEVNMSGATQTTQAPMTQAGLSPVVENHAQEGGAPQKDPVTGKFVSAKEPQEKAPQEAPKKYKVKINNRVMELTEEELIARASISEAAQQRFNEAARLKKEAESVISRIRDPKNVISALQDPALGLTKEQIRETFEEWYAREFIDPEQLTPEQKKLREAEERLKRYEEMEREREQEKIRQQEEAMTEQAREEMQRQIIEALDTSGLPKTNFTVRRLAYWMHRNQANGFDAPMSVVVSQVRNEINASIRDLVEHSDGDVLIKLLGDSIIQKVRKYDLEQLRKLRGGGGAQASSATQSFETQTQRKDPPLTSAEVNQRLKHLQRTGQF